MTAPTATPRPTPLRRNRNFRLLWIGEALSQVGSGATKLAYPLLVLLLTDSPVLAGVVGSASMAAHLVAQLPAGALVDRWNRRRVMLTADLVRAAAVAGLGLLVWMGHASWQLVLIVAVVTSVADAFFGPAHTSIIATVVPEEQLQPAFAANEARSHAASLVGPPAGGGLFGIAPAAPFIADAVSYVASFLALLSLRGDFAASSAARAKPTATLRADVAEGIFFLVRTSVLRALALLVPLMNLAFTGVMFTLILGLREGGASASTIGLVLAMIAVGGILGAMLAVRESQVRLWTWMVLISGGGCALVLVAALLLPSPLVAAPIAVLILLLPRANSEAIGYLITSTPRELHGRVSSALGLATGALDLLAPVSAGLLVSNFSAPASMGTFALVALLAAALVAKSKDLKAAESPRRRGAEDENG